MQKLVLLYKKSIILTMVSPLIINLYNGLSTKIDVFPLCSKKKVFKAKASVAKFSLNLDEPSKVRIGMAYF